LESGNPVSLPSPHIIIIAVGASLVNHAEAFLRHFINKMSLFAIYKARPLCYNRREVMVWVGKAFGGIIGGRCF
jgi:hypothetical protein